MKHAIRQFSAVCALLFVTAPILFAGSIDPGLIGLFPENTSEFAYVDLKQATEFPWFRSFLMQALPVRFYRFQQFITAPQLGLANEIDSITWAITSSQESGSDTTPFAGDIVAVATGQFDVQTADSFLESRNTPVEDFEGYKLYASGSDLGPSDVTFAFLDSSTVVFGPRALAQRLIRVVHAETASLNQNAPMIQQINQANGGGILWGVLDAAGAHQAIRQLVPAAANFPQASELIGKMSALIINVAGSSDAGIKLQLQAQSSSPQDALLLSQLCQAGVLMRRYRASQDDSAVAKILDDVSVRAGGDQLRVSMSLTNDQLLTLLSNDTFSLHL